MLLQFSCLSLSPCGSQPATAAPRLKLPFRDFAAYARILLVHASDNLGAVYYIALQNSTKKYSDTLENVGHDTSERY